MSTNNAVNLFGGQARAAVGDPTQAAGAGWVDLGLLPRIEISGKFHRQVMNNEINQMLADGAFGGLMGATVTLTLASKAAAILAATFPEFTDETSSISMSEDFAAIAAPSLIVQPIQGFGSGPSYIGNIWVPGAVAIEPGPWIYKIEETLQSTEFYTVTYEALLRLTDQAAQAILAGYRIMFIGDAADAISVNESNQWTAPPNW